MRSIEPSGVELDVSVGWTGFDQNVRYPVRVNGHSVGPLHDGAGRSVARTSTIIGLGEINTLPSTCACAMCVAPVSSLYVKVPPAIWVELCQITCVGSCASIMKSLANG